MARMYLQQGQEDGQKDNAAEEVTEPEALEMPFCLCPLGQFYWLCRIDIFQMFESSILLARCWEAELFVLLAHGVRT